MFYRSSGHSAVLARPASSHHEANDHDNGSEDPAVHALVEARRHAEQRATAKLSPFEKELLQAWSQDY